MFRLAVLALMSATASAFFAKVDPNSKQLRNLLKDATLVEGRGLGGNNNNNNNAAYYLNGAMDELSIKYTGCSNTFSINAQGQGGGGNKNGGQDNLMRTSVVTFEIREGCNGALVGKYATSVRMFADGYTESMMTEQEWRCETYVETYCGDCDGAEDEYYCYSTCITSGFDTSSSYDFSQCSSYLNQENNGNNAEDFEVQRYLECGKMQQNNNNNNNNNNGNAYNEDDYNTALAAYPYFDGKYRVGPYCASDGWSILLGVYYDQQCSIQGPSTVYSNVYGESLPFSSSSIVPKNTCVPCADPQSNGDGDAADAAREVCTEPYAAAVKCENYGSSYTTTYGATTSGCEFLSTYLPAMSSKSSFAKASQGAGAALAWVFAITTLCLGGYAFFLHRKIRRGGAGLAKQDGIAGSLA